MNYCPDPTERLDDAGERQCRPDGIACFDCGTVVPWDDTPSMVPISSSPDSPVVCNKCAMKIPEYVDWCARMDAQDAERRKVAP